RLNTSACSCVLTDLQGVIHVQRSLRLEISQLNDIMTEEYEHRYFDRKSSEWKIEDFLNECDAEGFDHKIGIYIRSLKSIAKSGEGGTCPDKRLAKRWKDDHESAAKKNKGHSVHFHQPLITKSSVFGINDGNANIVSELPRKRRKGHSTIRGKLLDYLDQKTDKGSYELEHGDLTPGPLTDEDSYESKRGSLTPETLTDQEHEDHDDQFESSDDEEITNSFNTETMAFGDYVNDIEEKSVWKLKDGRRIIDVLAENTAKTVKCISMKSKKELTQYTKSVIRLGLSSVLDLSSEFKDGMCQWFGDDWDDIKERVYKQVNMTPVSFQDEVKALVDTIDNMCNAHRYFDLRNHLYNIRTSDHAPMVKQVATIYFHVIDKFLENPFVFVDENGKHRNLSEIDYGMQAIGPLLDDIFSDLKDIIELKWGETASTSIAERRRKIDVRIVHRANNIELGHIECARFSFAGKAVQDRSKCLRVLKSTLDSYLMKIISDNDARNSVTFGLQFSGLDGQVIGIDLLDKSLYFGLEGPTFRLPKQITNIKCLRQTLETLYFFKKNIIQKASILPDPEKQNHVYTKVFHNSLEI
ncbi:1471_t:CDS:10, partial [Paraglomus occultum]